METESDKYIRLIQEGGIFSYSVTKGTFILPPRGLTLWEQMKKFLDNRFEILAVQNVLLPTLIPLSLISKEQEHVEGFAPELFHVSKEKRNLEKAEIGQDHSLVLRPTSEALFYEWFSRILHSYKQLPFLYNQWVQVFRVEKNTKPFLRNVEFLWQEGHTLHISEEEAHDFCLQILEIYKDYAEELLCLSIFTGAKTSLERFAGALSSYSVECLLPDYQCLQLATSHYFGEKFSRAFGVKFQNKENNLQFPSSTSWGSSTRSIGALVLAHADELGLVFPFKIAPCQIAIICNSSNNLEQVEYASRIKQELSSIYRCRLYNDNKQVGKNFANADKDGCALKIIIGKEEIEGDFVSISLRTSTKERNIVSRGRIGEFVLEAEKKIAFFLRNRSRKTRDENIFPVENHDELRKAIKEKRGIFSFPFCDLADCEKQAKEQFPSFSFRCKENLYDNKLNCIFCLRNPASISYFGRSY